MRRLTLLVCFMFASISLDAVWNQCGAQTYDATGTWLYLQLDNWVSGCEVDPNEIGTAVFTQTGNNVRIDNNGGTYKGAVSGAYYTVTATYAKDGGATTETLNLTLSSGTSGSGSTTWLVPTV